MVQLSIGQALGLAAVTGVTAIVASVATASFVAAPAPPPAPATTVDLEPLSAELRALTGRPRPPPATTHNSAT